MCGITGYLGARTPLPESAAHPVLTAMMTAISHRGPDSRGQWTDADAGLALGHLRLAILDLTPAGHQPMLSPSGRFVLVFNGEIYNHLDLRRRLEAERRAPGWRGSSDTETLLAAIEAWGLEATLAAAHGMFALALWSRADRVLWLARDRLGEKPLYYGWQGRGADRVLLFGSELKALRAHPAFAAPVSRSHLAEFLRHGHVGGDRSIHVGIAKVRPGEIVAFAPDCEAPQRRIYWDGAAVATAPRGPDPDPAAAVDRLEALLSQTIARQMLSDVPLGAFLSGGIDSSTVVALMQRLSGQPVHSFSIGFHEPRYNEAEFARAVAAHLGTRHTDLYVSDQELRDVVPRLPTIYDEPFADSSQIPTYLVARLARQHVTVALSGDGGDELFAGYGRYAHALRLRQRLAGLPGPLRRQLAAGVRAVPAALIDRLLGPLRPTPTGKEPNGQRLHRLALYAGADTLEALHRLMVSVCRDPGALMPGVTEPETLLAGEPPPRGGLGDLERMMQIDMLSYLPDDILAKVDRATMAVSLESRAPFLDQDVVEYAWSLPPALKLRDGQSKWVLRQVLYRHVPRALIDRPKMGFEVPVGPWLRGSLRDWAAALIEPGRLAREGHFDPAAVARLWGEHQSGACNHGAVLWNLLMFQAWAEVALADAVRP